MIDEPPPVRCDDPSTWRHKGEKIDLPRLLQLIEENGGPDGLDLHGCKMAEIDARPEALRPHAETYARKHGADASPPWLEPIARHGIDLGGVHLEDAVLIGARLEDANLSSAHLENANLSHAQLQDARIALAHLEDAELSFAHLQNTKLWEAHLQNAKLAHARLENAEPRGARLQNADLRAARLHSALWCYSHLDRTRIRRESLGQAIGDELRAKRGRTPLSPDLYEAREAYLTLKTNFDSIGRYDDASWAYVKEQQMEKAMYFPTTAGHRWIRERIGGALPPPRWEPGRLPRWLWWKVRSGFYHARLFVGLCPRQVKQDMARRDEDGNERDEWLSRWRWARNWAYELLTGYGERPHMPVIWVAVVILVFTGIYAAAGNVAAADGGGTHNFLTALTHSIGAFATIGFNTLEPQGWGARLLTGIEAMFGIGLFALFVFTLGNRMRRS